MLPPRPGETVPSSTDAPADAPTRKGGRNVPVAILVGVGLILVIVGPLWFWHWGYAIFVAVALFAGVLEVARALHRVGAHPTWEPVAFGTPVMILLSYYVIKRNEDLAGGLAVIVGGLALMTVASLLWRLRGSVEGFLPDASASLFLIAYLPLLGSSLVLLVADDRGIARTTCYLLCVVASDTGAYLFGSLFGKHKMAPHISPGKTWEGWIGGALLAAAVGGWLVSWLLDAAVWVGVVLGLCLAVAGAAGDLAESMIKRDAGLKDMSNLLPGHGGAMDRLDSLLVAAPVAWVVLYLLVPSATRL